MAIVLTDITVPLLESQKDYQRIYGTADDDTITANIAAASDWVERETNHAFVASNHVRILDGWRTQVALWPVPLVEVTSVTYVDQDGVTQTVDPASYAITTTTRPGVLRFKATFDRPGLGDVPDPIHIAYRTGYDTYTDAPQTLLAAVRILASHLYENREAAAPVTLHDVPMGVKRLIEIHRFPTVEGE